MNRLTHHDSIHLTLLYCRVRILDIHTTRVLVRLMDTLDRTHGKASNDNDNNVDDNRHQPMSSHHGIVPG
jgi:hypothetical protein